MRTHRLSLRWGLPIAVTALAVVVIISCSIGAVAVPFTETVSVVWSHITGRPVSVSTTTDVVVWRYRLPRVLMAACCGAGLAICGAALQTCVGNPLADPYLLGVSSGASTGVVVATVLGGSWGVWGTSAAAFVGALVTVAAVLLLGQTQGALHPLRVILGGVAMAYLLTAVTNFLQLWASPGQLRDIMFWMLGSVTGATWVNVPVVAAVTVAGTAALLVAVGPLNALTVGEEAAQTLGVSPHVTRWMVLAVASLVTGVLVMHCGGIGFVGLIVPHAVRMVYGVDHRRVLPLAAVWGAVFLVTVDTVSRMVMAPQELPLGVATALIGAPTFLILMLRQVR